MNIYSGKPNSMNNKFLQEAFISPTLQFRDTRDKMIIKSNIYTTSDKHRAILLCISIISWKVNLRYLNLNWHILSRLLFNSSSW